MALREKVRVKREEKGITQAELAKKSGVEHLVPKDEWTAEDMIDLVK